MRKCIVIGVLAIIGVGILVYGLSQPKKGSVEWHKRGYPDARVRLMQDTFPDRVQRVWARITGRRFPRLTTGEELALHQKVLFHQRALLEMGFLAKREVPPDGTKSMMVLRQLESEQGIAGHASGRLKGLRPGIGSQRGKTNLLIEVIAPSNDLPKWEKMIRKVDVAENGN